jgi:hypothetical protein
MEGDNLKWMELFRKLIAEKHLHHTFWCFNANSGDTGGLVKDDFKTWDEEKYSFVKEVLWKTEDGKFIGLDHKVPLGANGVALDDFDGVIITPAPVKTPASDITAATSESQTAATGSTSEVTVEDEPSGADVSTEIIRKATMELVIVAVVVVLLLIVFIAVRIAVKRWSDKKKNEEVVLPLSPEELETDDKKEVNVAESGESPDNKREDN